jgi:hypothetical protein
MRVTTPLLGLLAFAGACYTADIAGQANFNGCRQSAVITAGQGVSDLKQRIALQTSIAPADSILDVAITFTSAFVSSDSNRILAYGGSKITAGNTSSELKAEFQAQDLERYVSEDTGRLSDVVIFDPTCTAD